MHHCSAALQRAGTELWRHAACYTALAGQQTHQVLAATVQHTSQHAKPPRGTLSCWSSSQNPRPACHTSVPSGAAAPPASLQNQPALPVSRTPKKTQPRRVTWALPYDAGGPAPQPALGQRCPMRRLALLRRPPALPDQGPLSLPTARLARLPAAQDQGGALQRNPAPGAPARDAAARGHAARRPASHSLHTAMLVGAAEGRRPC